MSYRFMRVMVFFDLPVETRVQRREYRYFRNFLLKSGFLMMQESVYSKLALNTSTAEAIRRSVMKECPPEGIVQLLIVTEKQYNGIEFIVGQSKSDLLATDERLVIL
jgi:CRISPR-associated protein Cas2